MKKILTIIAILAIAINFTACNGAAEEQNKKVDAIKSEVMKIHDDAMAKMGDLGTLEKTLSEKASAIKSDTAMATDSIAMVTVTNYESAITSINNAKSGMMEWMNNFKAPADEATFEEKMAFYEEEMKKVTVVMEDINSSLATGEEMK
tara:strand:+ start:452 stop:895 length:444 start_codon:yes stop_codon:yes gene_type:complete